MGASGIAIGIIIQARMGSTRLPGKVLRVLGSKPLLAHVVERLSMLKTPATSIVATSDQPQDDVIVQWCAANQVACYRGSETDVLARYRDCAAQYDFSYIVRLTADNPLTDIEELDRLIAFHLAGGYDYSHSFGQMPLGVGAEIFTREALERSAREGLAVNHREHVNEYIEENPGRFSIGTLAVPATKHSPTLRLTIDMPEDFARVEALLAAMDNPTTEEAIARCSLSA